MYKYKNINYNMKAESKMTEKQWIAKFKKAGFELYKTKDVEKKLNAFYKVRKICNVFNGK